MEETHNHTEHQNDGHQNESHHQAHRAHHGTISKIKGHVGALEGWLAPIFEKAPHIPEKGIAFLTMIVPWLSIVFGIISLLGLLGSSALGVIIRPILAVSHGIGGIIIFANAIIAFFVSVMAILSFKPLRAMKKQGWDFSFYAFVASTLSSLLGMLVFAGGIGNAIGIVLGAYILFEIRKRYH